MTRVDRAAGRRRATPVKRTARGPELDEVPRAPADRLKLAVGTWCALTLVVLAGLVAERTLQLPHWAGPALGTALATLMAWALTWRAGGRPWGPALLTAVIGGVAVGVDWPPLTAGAAVGTVVLSALLAVLGTVPAANFLGTAREVLIATSIATLGGLGVAAFHAHMHEVRFGYVVLAVSLFSAIALVYRLAAGFHGLGRRGYVLGLGALGMLVLGLAYTEALGRWGSQDVVGQVDSLRNYMRDLLGAVPHPIEAVFGIPALAWGVFMRARRRQGWWVTAFATTATAAAAGRLLEPPVSTWAIVLGAVYSLVIGLAVGYIVIRVEQSFTGTHGRRARRTEEALAHRPEPGRLHPLQ